MSVSQVERRKQMLLRAVQSLNRAEYELREAVRAGSDVPGLRGLSDEASALFMRASALRARLFPAQDAAGSDGAPAPAGPDGGEAA